MSGALPVEGGLLIPGKSPGRGCDLLLAPYGAYLKVADLGIWLSYEDYHPSGAEGWEIKNWTATRGGDPIGVAVHGTGRYAEPFTQLRRQHGVLRRIGDRLNDRPDTLPLWAAFGQARGMRADLFAMEALCRALSSHPQWRAQLGVPSRVAQLLWDFAAQVHSPVPERTGGRRKSTEFFMTMQILGFQHRLWGRPLPDEPRPDLDVVVGAVVKALTANRSALPPDEPWIRKMVHKHYLDITPWPFVALMPT